MPVHTVRIEERLWSSASLLRKQDWSTIIHDIVSGTLPWPSREPSTLIAGCDDNLVRFVFAYETRADETLTFARSNIASVVREYADIIKQLSQGDLQESQFEALDMAKRVVHDSGGRKLAVLLPGVGSNFETNRRLFSLVVSLLLDTTKLGPFGTHGHHGKHGR